jgi:hypothetical protein
LVTAAALAAAALCAAPALSPALADEPEAPPIQVATPFDGVWKVTVSPNTAATNAGKQQFVDLVLFEAGKLSASACAQYGFAPSDVVVSDCSFTSAMVGEDETITWSATMANGHLNGTVVWTKAGGQVYHYALSGARYTEAVGEN